MLTSLLVGLATGGAVQKSDAPPQPALRVPIRGIAGRGMGSFVGGGYASGMSGAQIAKFLIVAFAHPLTSIARTIAKAVVRRIDLLAGRAEWYNSLASSCTNSTCLLTPLNSEHVPYSWRGMLSGYLPAYLYTQRKLHTHVPFAELRRPTLIDARAQSANDDIAFSQRIRAERGSAARGAGDR